MEIRSLDDILMGLKGKRIRLILKAGLEAFENPTSGFVMVDRASNPHGSTMIDGILEDFYRWTTQKAKYVGRTLSGYNFMIDQDKAEVLSI